jgi:hypothetical protein
MSRGRTITSAIALSLLLACSGSRATELDDAVDPTEPLPGVGADSGVTTADPEGPHALGTLVLGESHGESGSRRIVTVTFVPDATTSTNAPRTVAGCEVTAAAPKNDAAPKTSFDAGAIAISGATTPITLYPPYAHDDLAPGAPFVTGAKLEVQASGATGAGFESFDETFTGTKLVVASPSLAKLSKASVFGPGALPIGWAPGADEIWVTVSGEGGSLRCKADDAKGHFDVPREALKTALGHATTLSVSLARERTELKKGLKTKGEIEGAVVRPVGWLALTTTSIETASFQCSGAECGGVTTTPCQDCRTTLCKTEYDACSADATCPSLRTCLDACTDTGCRTSCFAKWPEPAAKAKNGALYKCQCFMRCATECTAECK